MVGRGPGTVAQAPWPLGVWAGLVLASACAARADDAPLEQVIVTGSRIPRPGFDSASPIVVLPESSFELTSDLSVERILNTLPQIVPAATAFSNDPSSEGQATVSLRGLGVSQTLVLVDGKRLMPGDGRGSPDLNVLPPGLVSSVEVVSGGASAAYGSDAIAGVVNFRLKDRYQGVALSAQVSHAERGDADDYTVGLTAGTEFAGGRGNALIYAAYTERGQVNQSDRAASRVPLEYFPDESTGAGPGRSFVPTGSVVTPEGMAIVFSGESAFEQLFAGYGYAPGSVTWWPGIGVNPDGTVFTTGSGEPGSVANYRGPVDPDLPNTRYHAWNFADTTALKMPLDRTSIFMQTSIALSDRSRLYGQAIWSDYTVTRQLAPVDAGILLVPPNNPYLPTDLKTLLDSRAAPALPFRYFRRFVEIGPRTADDGRDLLQLMAGAAGQLSESWSYDAYVQWGENKHAERQTGALSIGRFQELAFAPDGGRSICGEFDPFRIGHVSAECADYVTLNGTNRSKLERTIAEATFSGPVLEAPAGPTRAAVGVYYRSDDFHYRPDPALAGMLPGVPGVFGPRPDITGFATAPERSGRQSNTDLYAEILVPLLRDRPGAESLDLDFGYRRSDYLHGGTADAYKTELTYRPVRPVLLRGSYQHAVRAPTIDELFYPQLPDLFFISENLVGDPCDVRGQARNGPDREKVEALCLAQGMPQERLADFTYSLKVADGVTGGNPHLESEQADTITFGIVLDTSSVAPALGSMRMSLDWYSIDLGDAVGRWDSQSSVQRCYDPRYNPDYQVSNVYCRFFTRDAQSGDIYALIIDRNIGRIRTSGVDFQIDWSKDAGPGRLSAGAFLTRVADWRYSDPSGGTTDYVGTIGGGGLGRALPRWKALLNLGYSWQQLEFVARWNWIDGMRDATYRDFELPARNYLDLGAVYGLGPGSLDGLSVSLGVDNATDVGPPLFPSYARANTDPSVYDVIGRRYYLALGYRFQ